MNTPSAGRRLDVADENDVETVLQRLPTITKRTLTTPELDKTSAIPLHHQLRTAILAQLGSSVLLPGDRLPTERELAGTLGISVAPVRQAFLDLAQQGYIIRLRARGSFVNERLYEERVSSLGSFSEVMRQQNSAYETTTVLSRSGPAPEPVLDALSIRGANAFRLLRVALLDGSPAALLDAYLPPQRFPGLGDIDMEKQSLYRTLKDRYGVEPRRATNTIEVALCNEDDAGLLQVELGTPTARVTSVTFDQQDVAFEYVRITYRPERFKLTFDSA
jgi:GntR family transcriptional regulator